jgi:hypothetical protein
MNKQLYNFFDNTKQLHIFLSIALLLIIVIIVAPIGKGVIKYSGQVIIIGILMYILFKNFTETHNFVLVQKAMEERRLKNKLKKKGEADAKGPDAKGPDAKGPDAKGPDAKGPDEDELSSDTMLDIKNNTIASYVLCGFILVLLVYVIYSLFD